MTEEKVEQQAEVIEGLLKTDSGIEYSEHQFRNTTNGEERTLRYFRTLKPERLSDEGETKEEYIFRKRTNASIVKKYRRGKVSWDPYVFGKQHNGMSCNKKNREFIDGFIETLKKREEVSLTEEVTNE
jgi:hypothetical protein